MGIIDNFKDAVRRKKSRNFSRELANQFCLSPLCSDYENLFAQIRPLVNEMKVVMPYAVTDRGARVPEARAPELAWLRNPNDEMGWAEFADLMFATWLTEDELDIHVWKDDRDKVIGYTVIPPQCRIYLGYGRWIWQVMTTDGMETLDEDQVMRLRFSRSPRDVQRGVSPASAVRVWAQIDDLIAQYQKAYFENGAIPATITFITASTFEKYDKTRKELENKLKGAHNRNKTVYAWRQYDNDTGQSVDQVEVKTIQGNNSTLAIREIVDIVNDRLNKAVGVSNFILGDDSSAKYDNAELTRQQFIMNRVYPALISFWNQFEHELNRITGGIGYKISFDLEIPELTEREKAKAEIGRIRGEALVNLISAGASGESAVEALELPDTWLNAARGIYNKGLVGELNSPVEIDYTATTPAKATVDEVKSSPKEPVADVIHGHNCTCHHSLDKLPPMTREEQKLYKQLVDLASKIINQQQYDMDAVVEKMMDILANDALAGSKQGLKSLALLADENVAKEIIDTLKKGDYYVSESLKERISTRAKQLATGYADYTQKVVEQTLAGAEDLTANEIAERLSEALPREKAELIARNETNYAIRSGRLEQDESLAEKYGLNVQLVWRTSGDADVCPICEAMEGTTVELGKAFPDSIETEDGVVSWEHSSWNDSGRITSAHVNCRCFWDEELV